jgi:hypothetical protein
MAGSGSRSGACSASGRCGRSCSASSRCRRSRSRFRSPLLFGLLRQFGPELVQSLPAIGPRFCHPRSLFFLFPVQGGGGEFVEVLHKIERRQLPLALPQLVFGLPPFQQGRPLFRFQLPHPSPAQVLLRCPVDALVGQAAVVYPRRVAVPLEVGVLDFGPPLPGFQQPFFRSGAVFPAAAQLGMFPVVPLEVLLGIAVDAVNRPLRVHEVGVRLFPARQRRARIVDRPLVGVPFADLLSDKIQYQVLPLRGVQLARQGDFDLPVGRAVRPFVPVGGLPEQAGSCSAHAGRLPYPVASKSS